MKALPKATPNNNPFHENDSGVDLVKPKNEVIKDAGFTPKQAERFQQLASNPELVERAKAEARENDDIVSRSLVLNMIKNEKRKNEIQKQVEQIEKKSFECLIHGALSIEICSFGTNRKWEWVI